jgi:hypothetical protein
LLKHLVRTPARTLLPVLLLACADAAHAQERPTQDQQREHVVRRGDTLWDLARAYLQNPFLWRLIYEANRDVVENPHWIYPAERLVIPPILRQDAPESPSRDMGDPIGDPVSEALTDDPMLDEPATDEPMVVTTLDLRRPIVPLAEYLATPWVSRTAEREVVGRVLRLADPSAATDRLPSNLHPNDRVHLGGLTGARPQRGDSLVVVRIGRHVGEWGRIVEPTAVLIVESSDGSVATARVARQFGTARLGDPVLPLGPLPQIGLGDPEPVPTGPEGHLLQFVTPEAIHGPTDLAIISLGSASGVGIGDEFSVYVPARAVNSQMPERLPPEPVGTLRVVKVDERTATVRVLTVSSAAMRDGLPVRMTRRMP